MSIAILAQMLEVDKQARLNVTTEELRCLVGKYRGICVIRQCAHKDYVFSRV
jgi:hypothetical protein